MLEDVHSFTTTPTFFESDVIFVDPKVENEKVTKFDFVSGLCCSLILFFLVMTTIATLMLWSKSRDTLKLRN